MLGALKSEYYHARQGGVSLRMGMKTCFLTSVLCLLLINIGAKPVPGPAIVLDFDKAKDGTPIDVSLTGKLVANSYLASYGVTLSDVTPATQLAILDLRKLYEGQAIRAASGTNALGHIGSNDPISFTLNFKTPLQKVTFSRPVLIAGPTGITFPEWKATALDSTGRSLGDVGEPGGGYYSDSPARTFILKGPGIKGIRFNSNNHHFAAFHAAIIDDLTLFE